MAAGGGDAGGAAERAGASHPLRQHRQEEVGRQLGLHGALRLRRHLRLLVPLGLPHVVRRTPPPLRRPPRPRRARPGLPHRAGLRRRLPGRDAPLLPVRLRRHHAHPRRRLASRPRQLPGVDALRPALAHLLLYHWGVQPLEPQRVPVQSRCHGLRRRIRHPPLLRHRRLHRRLLGGSEDGQGQGGVPAEQHPPDARRRGSAVDGVDGLQRRRAVRRQHRRVARRREHALLHGHQRPGLALPRLLRVRAPLRHRRRPGHDHRPGVHHPGRRAGAGLGRDAHGRRLRERAVVHHDGAAQAEPVPESRRRHARRAPHARRGGQPRRRPDGAPGGAAAQPPLLRRRPPVRGPRVRPQGRPRRRGAPAGGHAAGRDRLHRGAQRRRDDRGVPGRRAARAATAQRGAAGRRRRRHPRGGRVRGVGRRADVRAVSARKPFVLQSHVVQSRRDDMIGSFKRVRRPQRYARRCISDVRSTRMLV